MALVTLNDANLTAIADAIREKGVEGSFTPSQMAPAIASIQASSGDGGTMYESAEAMYQAIRPKSWPDLPDAKTFMTDLLTSRDQVITAIFAVPAANLSSISFTYTSYYKYYSYRFYKVNENKELVQFGEALRQYHKQATVDFSNHTDTMQDDEGNYLYVVAVHIDSDVSSFNHRDDSPLWPYAVDIDWYVNSKSWGGSANDTTYATYYLYHVFPRCQYIRFQCLVPGYAENTSTSSPSHIGLSSSTFNVSSGIIRVIRKCEFALMQHSVIPLCCAIGDIYPISSSYVDDALYRVNKYCPTIIHRGTGAGSKNLDIPYGKSTPGYIITPKIILDLVGEGSATTHTLSTLNMLIYNPVEIEIHGQYTVSGTNLLITRYNGNAMSYPGQIYNLVMTIYDAISNIDTVTTKTVSRLFYGDLTQEEITELQGLGFTLSYS